MTVRTKPLRIFETDHAPLRLLAELGHISTADVVHKALAEYMVNHKQELAVVFRDTQRAIAAGDLDGLTVMFQAGARAQARQLADRVKELRGPRT